MHSFVLEIGQVVTAPNHKQYYARLFSKIKTKQDDGDVFWWIFRHVATKINIGACDYRIYMHAHLTDHIMISKTLSKP